MSNHVIITFVRKVDYMALDGIVLHQTIEKLNAFAPMKINRIQQASDYEFMFQTFAKGRKDLLISLHPNFARIHFTNHRSSSNLGPTHFVTLFRKHLEGGIIHNITQRGFDRVITLEIEHRDEMGVMSTYFIHLEFLGRYTNLILTDSTNVIIESFKRISDFENQDRVILPNVEYEVPNQQNKASFLEIGNANPNDSFMKNYEGISPLLDKEIYYRYQTEDQSLDSIKKEILSSKSLFVYEKDFHIIELKHLKSKFKRFDLMDGFDAYFQQRQEQDRILSHTQNMTKILRRELKKNKRKINKLSLEYEKALEVDYLKDFGDLLMTYAAQNPAGNKEISLTDFEGNTQTIPLDPRKNAIENAQDYYKRYRKRKNSRSHLQEQIEISKNDNKYYETLLQQIDQANLEDAFEIEEELIEYGLIQKKKDKHPQKKKKKKRNYRKIQFDEDCTIYIGKNNIQNETVSFKVANKEDYWFHAANAQGAHVVVKTSELTEKRLRISAQFAAYFSKNRYGSSVEVHYTLAKHVEKIPKAPKGMVKIKNHKSIFIDPDEDLILSYLDE